MSKPVINMLQLQFNVCRVGTLVDIIMKDNCTADSLRSVTGRFTVTGRGFEKGKDGQTFLQLEGVNSGKRISLGWRDNEADIESFIVVPDAPKQKEAPSENKKGRRIHRDDMSRAMQVVNDLEGRIAALENLAR